MQTTINDLVNAILEETKRQESKRNEYLSLVHNLIDKTERKEEQIHTKISLWLHRDAIGRYEVVFSRVVSLRKNSELCRDDIFAIRSSNWNIDNCINTLYDFGEHTLDKFIEHLVKVAIPQFLQGRKPHDYYVR